MLAGLAAVVAASFVLPGMLNQQPASSVTGAEVGAGLPAGSAVPSFAGRDLLTGKEITTQTVYGQKTLLFFSEGVMCQACLQQIQGLQQVGTALASRGIQLVSITNDAPSDLGQAATQYGITTPLISDADRSMSQAFNTLGKGMHATTPGHAFALLFHGKVLWYRDYYLPPDGTMYVPPDQLLAAIPS